RRVRWGRGGPGSAREGQHGLGEPLPADVVVGEHVHGGGGGGEEHGVARLGQAGGGGHHLGHRLGPGGGDLHHGDVRRVLVQGLAQPVPVAAEEDRGAQPRRRRPDQVVDLGALEQAAGDPHHRVVGGQRRGGGVRVG